jgi:hypothetical protein
MRRRYFIVGAISATAVSRAAAQAITNSPRLAIFSPFEPNGLMHEGSENRGYRTLFEELRRLGHVDGQNLTVERYSREQNSSGPAALVAEVVRSNPDVIYSVGLGAMLFKRETAKIPIVALTTDPIAQGLSAQPMTSTRFCAAPIPAISRSTKVPSSSCRSTSRPRRCLGSQCRQPCLPARTLLLNSTRRRRSSF